MSERLAVCQALAAMVRHHGEPTEEEVTFVGMAAMQLGLTPAEHEEVQGILRRGRGEFEGYLSAITSRPMRAFFLRRMLAAILLDEEIQDGERVLIDKTIAAFHIDAQLVADLIAWIKVSVDVEKRLAQLLAQVA